MNKKIKIKEMSSRKYKIFIFQRGFTGLLCMLFSISLFLNLKYVVTSISSQMNESILKKNQKRTWNYWDELNALAQIMGEQRDGKVIGVWAPNSDPVALDQARMIFAYHLFPAKIQIATLESVGNCDYLLSRRVSLRQLRIVIGSHFLTNEFREIKGTEKSVVLSKCGDLTSSDAKAFSPPELDFVKGGLIIVAFLGVILVAYQIRKWFPPCFYRGGIFAVSFALGLLLIVLLSCTLGFIGSVFFPLLASSSAIACLLSLIFLSRSFCSNRLIEIKARSRLTGKNSLDRIYPTCLVLYLLLMVSLSLMMPVSHITGLGVWGLKAKAFYSFGGVDLDFLRNSNNSFCHPTYPLGYPSLVAFFYAVMGGANDWLIKLLPPAIGTCLFGLLIHILGRKGKKSLAFLHCLFVLLLIMSPSWVAQFSRIQAESLLLLFAISGIYCFFLFLEGGSGNLAIFRLGILFLAGTSCIKQEGIVFLVVCTTSCLLVQSNLIRNIWSQMKALLAVLCIFVLPWQLFCRYNVLAVNDFSGAIVLKQPLIQTLAILHDSWKSMLYFMFCKDLSIALIWYFGLASLILWRQLLFRSRECLFLVIASLTITGLFSSIYVFSVHEGTRLDWHMQANERLIMLPTCLILLATGRLIGHIVNSNKEVRRSKKNQL